jgi:sugar (pentulose or hexulose) kinase
MNKDRDTSLIFDIGPTKSTYFLLDRNFCTLVQGKTVTQELFDEEGDLMQDLDHITDWITEIILDCTKSEPYRLSGINFTTYEASLVNVDDGGQRVTPYYNSDKKFPYLTLWIHHC